MGPGAPEDRANGRVGEVDPGLSFGSCRDRNRAVSLSRAYRIVSCSSVNSLIRVVPGRT